MKTMTPRLQVYDPGVVGNVWIKQSVQSNLNRTLLVQFSSQLLNESAGTDDLADRYYEKLYLTRDGYVKLVDFWEIPQWIANAASLLDRCDVYIVRDLEEFHGFLEIAAYQNIAFSVLDVNKALIKGSLKYCTNSRVVIGGYIDKAYFNGCKIDFFNSIHLLKRLEGRGKQLGMSYRHFKGTHIVPRLKLSEGCKYKCSFCGVINNGSTVEEENLSYITAQVSSYKDLKFSLIYIDDKTFGQAANYKLLETLYEVIKTYNKEFVGFIVQTTANQVSRKLSSNDLKRCHIAYVEIGVETYNDSLLKDVRKPHRVKSIDDAFDKLEKLGIAAIPNVIIGMPGETSETYLNTLNFVRKYANIISHLNVYNLALYEGTEMASGKDVSGDDLNENVLAKSFHGNKKIHEDFSNQIFKLAIKLLK